MLLPLATAAARRTTARTATARMLRRMRYSSETKVARRVKKRAVAHMHEQDFADKRDLGAVSDDGQE